MLDSSMSAMYEDTTQRHVRLPPLFIITDSPVKMDFDNLKPFSLQSRGACSSLNLRDNLLRYFE